ncbi:MAG: dethiobiotin synthase [Verrucomicrobiota bacterium]
MSGRGIFVTGTDTDVGKTWVATRLLKLLGQQGFRSSGMKPIECGGREDSSALLAASSVGDLDLDQVNPVTISEPLAPAASSDQVSIDFDRVGESYLGLALKSDWVVVEGAGGWLVPVDAQRSMADLAVSLDLPVVVVAANRLGVLNHTLLTLKAIESVGLPCCGVFLNTINESDLSIQTNARVLRASAPFIRVIDDDLSELVSLLTE